MSAETDSDGIAVHGRTVVPQGNSIFSHSLVSCPDGDTFMYDIFRTHSYGSAITHDSIPGAYNRCSRCIFEISQSVRFVFISYNGSLISLIYIIRTDR